MARDIRTGLHARFFAEDLISYILRRNGCEWNPDRSDPLHLLQNRNFTTFDTDIGDMVVLLSAASRESVIRLSHHTWIHVNDFSPDARGSAVYKRLILLSLINSHRDVLLRTFCIMAIISHFCLRCARRGQPNLIKNAVEALEFILNSAMVGGFLELLLQVRQFVVDFFDLD